MKKYFLKRKRVFLSIIICCMVIFSISANAHISKRKFKEGKLQIQFNDKKNTTGIVYKTVGWVIHKTKAPNMDAYNWDSKAILMQGKNYRQVDSQDIPGERVLSDFLVPFDEMNKALIKAGLGEIKEGEIIYIDSIFETWDIKSNKKRSGPHYTYQKIANAEGWSNTSKQDLKSYYNIPLSYESGLHPVEKEIIIDGVKQPKEFILKGKTGTTHKVPLLESFEHQGKTVKIKKTYFYWNADAKKKKRFEVVASDPRVTKRNPTIPAGGITVVAEYKSEKPTLPPPSEGGKEGKNLEPVVSAVIRADDRGAEAFEVLDGIPTTEDLYVQVDTKEFLYSYNFENTIGKKDYSISISKTYNLSWREDHGSYYTDSKGNSRWSSNWVSMSDSETVTNTYKVTREFAYWIISNLQVYGIDKTVVNNYALPNGETVTIRPSGTAYKKPTVSVSADSSEKAHIKEPTFRSSITLPSKSLNGGTSRPSVPSEDWASVAESEVKEIKVKNDKLIISETTIMNDEWVEKSTSSPGSFPEPKMTSEDALYQKDLTIEAEKINKESAESTGKIHYSIIANVGGGGQFLTYPIEDINPVTVHTPVVCYPNVYDDIAFNQRVEPNTGCMSVILDRRNNITLPTTGQHLDILGYGDRDYKKYTRKKQVRFPFDIYRGVDRPTGTYIKSGTWIDVPLEYDNMNFYTPIWVDEGDYEVEFRAIAINAPYDISYEKNANLDLRNYVAYETIPVQVIGRLYDFKITDIEDYPTWQEVFRTGADTLEHTKNYYWVGTKNQNGEVKGNSSEFTVPIINGSHPTKTNIGVLPKGYKFKFELVTIGNLFNPYDCINITPTFYYIDKNGQNRQEIDLYYSENSRGKDKHFIKVGSATDKNNPKYMRLGNADRNVPESEIKATSYILGLQEEILKNNKTKLGYFSQIVLPSSARMFIGNTYMTPTGVDPVKVKKSQQHWYGEYYIPNKAYAVPKGYDVFNYAKKHGLKGNEGFWLKKGYIMVNFKIDTVKDQQFTRPDLSYYGVPFGNMWSIEGAIKNKVDDSNINFVFNSGDVILYDLDKKASDDYKSGGTH